MLFEHDHEYNQDVLKRRLPIKSVLKPELEDENFSTFTFHPIDSGLLFAGTNKSFVHLYDLSKPGASFLVPDTPAFSINLTSKKEQVEIADIALRADLGHQALLSLSLTKGLCLYDLRAGCKTMHTSEPQAIKSRFYPSNPTYLAVLTKQGSMELYDQRSFGGGPVQIYNEEYQAEKIKREIDNEKDRIEMKNRETHQA